MLFSHEKYIYIPIYIYTHTHIYMYLWVSFNHEKEGHPAISNNMDGT